MRAENGKNIAGIILRRKMPYRHICPLREKLRPRSWGYENIGPDEKRENIPLTKSGLQKLSQGQETGQQRFKYWHCSRML